MLKTYVLEDAPGKQSGRLEEASAVEAEGYRQLGALVCLHGSLWP